MLLLRAFPARPGGPYGRPAEFAETFTHILDAAPTLGDKARFNAKESPPMKVEGPRATDAAASRRNLRAGAGQSVFSLDETPVPTRPGPVNAPMSLGALDSILALQAAPDAAQGRAKAVKRGQTLLDLLDEIRDGMLSGLVGQGVLRRLSGALQAPPDGFLDPGLQSVMNDIELRAQVELAKMQVMSGRADSALRA